MYQRCKHTDNLPTWLIDCLFSKVSLLSCLPEILCSVSIQPTECLKLIWFRLAFCFLTTTEIGHQHSRKQHGTWDPNSPLSTKQQYRFLIESCLSWWSWLRLGKYGRNVTPGPLSLALYGYQGRNSNTDEERASDGQITGAFWIWTWFRRKDDEASQAATDVAFKRLRLIVMQDGDPNGINSCLKE